MYILYIVYTSWKNINLQDANAQKVKVSRKTNLPVQNCMCSQSAMCSCDDTIYTKFIINIGRSDMKQLDILMGFLSDKGWVLLLSFKYYKCIYIQEQQVGGYCHLVFVSTGTTIIQTSAQKTTLKVNNLNVLCIDIIIQP